MGELNEYHIGVVVRVVGTFTDIDGNEVDPAAVFATVKTPAGGVTTYTYGVDAELVRDSQGVYYIDDDGNAEGKWWTRIYSTGAGQAAGELGFIIKVSRFL